MTWGASQREIVQARQGGRQREMKTESAKIRRGVMKQQNQKAKLEEKKRSGSGTE